MDLRHALIPDGQRQVVVVTRGRLQSDDRMAGKGTVVQPEAEIGNHAWIPGESHPCAVLMDQTGGPDLRVRQCVELATGAAGHAIRRLDIRARPADRPRFDSRPDVEHLTHLSGQDDPGTAPVDWERYGGHNKGRGMEPELLRAGTPTVVDPLYPRPIFGSGGNMAFRTETLRNIGGFDNRLGAGTLTRGGEDTKALSLLLEAGYSILHWPPAVTWHYHRATDQDLATKLFGNAAGLTAYYTSMFMSSPKFVWRIVSLLPRGFKDAQSQTRQVKEDSLPAHLTSATRRGLTQGPWLYVRETVRQRRAYGVAKASTRAVPSVDSSITRP